MWLLLYSYHVSRFDSVIVYIVPMPDGYDHTTSALTATPSTGMYVHSHNPHLLPKK